MYNFWGFLLFFYTGGNNIYFGELAVRNEQGNLSEGLSTLWVLNDGSLLLSSLDTVAWPVSPTTGKVNESWQHPRRFCFLQGVVLGKTAT